jgi:hypothetical protein
MTNTKKALVFQHNKTALASANLDQRACLFTLADRLNLMLTAKSGPANWERKLSHNWENFQYLTILSWHNTKGTVIADTTSAANPSVLKPIHDGKRDDCRSAGIKFIQVQLKLDYSDLATLDRRHPILSSMASTTSSYLKLPRILPMKVVPHGGNDICSLSAEEVKCTILDVTYQDGLYDLLVPSFNLTLCHTDSTGIYGKLKSMVVCLALDTIRNTLFMVLVPNYSIKPQPVLDHIWQSYVDANGKTVELNVQVYYTNFMNSIRSFYDLEEYPIDLAGVFQDHMNPSMQKSFCVHYPTFGATCSRDGITQHSILMDMLTMLIKAENDLTNILDIVRVEQCGREQCHASDICPTMPSVVKKTL